MTRWNDILTYSQAPEMGSLADLQPLLDAIADEVILVGDNHRLLLANRSAMGGAKGLTSGGVTCYGAFLGLEEPCRGPFWNCPLEEVLRTGKAKAILLSEGHEEQRKSIQVLWTPFREPFGGSWVVVEVRRDVTSEKELERVLLSRRHQLQVLGRISSAVSSPRELDQVLQVALDNVLELIDGSIGGILVTEEDGLRYRVQRGLPAPEIAELKIKLGEGIAGRVAEEARPLVGTGEEARLQPDFLGTGGIGTFISIPLMARDRVVGVLNAACSRRRSFGEEEFFLLRSIGYYLGTVIEQARLNERLAKARERYQALLQHALTAQEQERRRIARELHDETSQAITSLTLSLQALLEMAEGRGIGDAEFLQRLKKAHAYAVYAGNEVVKLMKELRPTLLDELGLAAAIQHYAKETLLPKGIEVAMEQRGEGGRLPSEVEITLYRIAQGAIGNILEHSGAKRARIVLEFRPGECLLTIEDDGRGFDVTKITRVEPSGRGAGLFTMKERVSLVGGSCQVDSQPGKGTRVSVRVPIPREDGRED